MVRPVPPPSKATVADLAALDDEQRFEIIGGDLVERAAPAGEHGGAQGAVRARLDGFDRKPGGPPDRPGGWWLATETTVELSAHEVVTPDLVGWRRERVPVRPRGFPIRTLPDWIGEVLSPQHRRHDLVAKLRLYHRHGVKHYWIIDPELETLSVHRWHRDGYLTVLTGERGERVRAEPFDAIELAVASFFGDDPED
jgi:Uma2 family endonuclease